MGTLIFAEWIGLAFGRNRSIKGYSSGNHIKRYRLQQSVESVKTVDDLSTHQDNEMLADMRDYDAAMERIAAGEELVPAEVVYALLDGGNPIRVWREYRGLSPAQLAAKAGIRASYLSQLEAGKRDGTVEILSTLAAELGVALDDLAG